MRHERHLANAARPLPPDSRLQIGPPHDRRRVKGALESQGEKQRPRRVALLHPALGADLFAQEEN